MTDLLTSVLNAYGGVDRWRELSSVTARKRFGGAIWDIKAVPGIVDDGEITVWIKDQRTSLSPFTAPDLKTAYTPQRVGIETTAGDIVEMLDDPRASFAGHTRNTLEHIAIGVLHRVRHVDLHGRAVQSHLSRCAYRRGRILDRGRPAMAHPARRLPRHDRHPQSPPDPVHRFRRTDSTSRLPGRHCRGSPGAHYVSDFDEIGGLVIPRTRMIYVRDADNHPIPEQLVVSIELTDVTVN